MKINSFKALIVEDDHAIAQLLKIHLSELGLQVNVFHEAETAFSELENKSYALLILDWMLPGIQGIDLLKKIRSTNTTANTTLKILMLTAKADADSIVMAIEAGADDYLTKPFDEKVFLARVRNLLRRIDFEKNILNPFPASIETDGLSIHFAKYTVQYHGENIHLTPSEFKLLASLFKAQGHVLTRDQLMGLIQGDDVNVTGRTIDTHIFALRKKLGVWADHIETIRGVGYRILISDEDKSVGPESEGL